MLVATAADSVQGFLGHLSNALGREGIPFLFEPLEPPFSWAKLVRWELDLARRFPRQKIVFVDAWDFIFQGTREELESATQTDLLFHGERRCWPEPHKADLYPPDIGPYRFVNGTGPAGTGEAISEAIEYGMKHFPIRGEESSMYADNDQRFWTDVYLSGRGRVDSFGNLSVQLNGVDYNNVSFEDNRIVLDTGAIPAFVHTNGASHKVYGEMIERLLR